MPLGQLPTAITAHIVDGGVDPWYLVPPLRLNDVLKMHTEFSDSSLSSTSFVLVMNKDAYDRLPRDLKTVIDNNSGQAAANRRDWNESQLSAVSLGLESGSNE